MEPEGSLPHSQASANRPYPGPGQSSPHTHIPLQKVISASTHNAVKKMKRFIRHYHHLFVIITIYSTLSPFLRHYHNLFVIITIYSSLSPFIRRYHHLFVIITIACSNLWKISMFLNYLGMPARTRVNQKVKAIFKLRGNRHREELAHCAVLTVPIEEFSHVQYSALPSVEQQQRGRKHGMLLCKIAPSKNNVA